MVQEGENVTFICDSITEIQWYFSFKNRLLGRGRQITIPNVHHNNEGEYECKSRTHKGEIFRARAVLEVIGKYYCLFPRSKEEL